MHLKKYIVEEKFFMLVKNLAEFGRGALISLLSLASMLLASPAVEAVIRPGNIVIQTDSDGTVPRGPVWVSESFANSHNFSLTLAVYDRAAIVVSPKDTGGLQAKKDYLALPYPITNTGLHLTIVGDIEATWGSTTFRWSAADYTQGVTKRTTDANYNHLAAVQTPQMEKKGSLRYNVRVVMFCNRDRCQVPKETTRLESLNLRLHNTFLNFNPAVEIMDAGFAKAKFTFVKSCTFSVPAETTSFTGISLLRGKPTDTYPLLLPVKNQGEFATRFSVKCTSDPADKKSKSSMYVNLTPSLGYVDGNPKMAATTLKDLGIVYDVNRKPAGCLSGKTYGETQTLGEVKKVGSGKKAEWRVDNAKIYWGLCQNNEHMKAGPFSSTINYTVWLD